MLYLNNTKLRKLKGVVYVHRRIFQVDKSSIKGEAYITEQVIYSVADYDYIGGVLDYHF